MPLVTPNSGTAFKPARNVGQIDLSFSQAITAAQGLTSVTLAYTLGDASMVSLTDPTNPTVVTAGVYAFTAVVRKNPGSGSAWQATLVVDDNFYSVSPAQALAGAIDADKTALSATFWGNAADPFHLAIFSAAAGGDTFNGDLYIQRIT